MSTPEQPKKPRLFRIGPGLILAIVASLLVWRYWTPEPAAPPVGSTRGALPVASGATVTDSAPDPGWLLEQKDELTLSAAQFQKLRELKTRWDTNTRDLRAALQDASAEFRQTMQDKPGATMPELQERGAPVAELTRRLMAARRAWWDEASGVLSVAQKQRAATLWTRRFLGKNQTNQKK